MGTNSSSQERAKMHIRVGCVLSVFILVCFASQFDGIDSKVLVGLKQHNLHQAEELLLEISNPQSELYGQFLTPREIGNLIAPPTRDIQFVSSYLVQAGGKNLRVLPSRDWIEVRLPFLSAHSFQKQIPEEIEAYVDLIKVIGSQESLHIDRSSSNFFQVEKSLPVPWMFVQPTGNSFEFDLWIIPRVQELETIKEFHVQIEPVHQQDDSLMISYPIEDLECVPCSQLTRKPFSSSFNRGKFCDNIPEEGRVCFAFNQHLSSVSGAQSYPKSTLWRFSSWMETEDGQVSQKESFGEENSHLILLDDKAWDPNSQKAIYQESTTLVATSNATQIVWGTGTYGYSSRDLQQFYTQNSIPSSTSYVVAEGEAGDSTGDNYVEATLDIQYITAMAPQMHSACVNTDNNTNAEGSTGFGSAFLQFATDINSMDDPPNVISLSLGSLSWASCNILCTQAVAQGAGTLEQCQQYVSSQFQVCMYSSENEVERINTELMKMGMIGVSVFAASGDGGNHFSFGPFKPFGANSNLARTLNQISCNYTLPTFPAASPWVTAVGASQMVSSTNGYSAIGCSTQTGGGITGGCGFSWQFAMPSYQTQFVNSYLNAFSGTNFGEFNSSGRAYPDMSAIGSSIPIVVNGKTELVGGTSCSTPELAGLFSMINDARENAGKTPLGFINTRLYQYAATNSASMFTDITSGTSNCGIGKCCATGFSAAQGWDVFTGFGNPIFSGLLQQFLQ